MCGDIVLDIFKMRYGRTTELELLWVETRPHVSSIQCTDSWLYDGGIAPRADMAGAGGRSSRIVVGGRRCKALARVGGGLYIRVQRSSEGRCDGERMKRS